MPTKGWLTSAFARERVHPILHLARPHEGIDVSAPMGMEIDAPAAGVITQVSWVEGYGNMLSIEVLTGSEGTTYYCTDAVGGVILVRTKRGGSAQ